MEIDGPMKPDGALFSQMFFLGLGSLLAMKIWGGTVVQVS